MTKQLKQVKNTMALGIGSMAGMYAVGSIGGLPGMPANNITGITGSAMNLANVGNLANIGMSVVPQNGRKRKRKKSYNGKGLSSEQEMKYGKW